MRGGRTLGVFLGIKIFCRLLITKTALVKFSNYIGGTDLKIREDIRKLTTSQSNLARALGITQPRVNQLIEEEVVVRDDNDPTGGVMLLQSLKNFYQSRRVTDEGLDYWKEKALRERVNRQRDELKLKKEDGSVYDAATIEAAFIEMLTILRTQLLGLPSKFAVLLEGKSRAEIYETMTAEIEGNLLELSNSYRQANFKEVVDDANDVG